MEPDQETPFVVATYDEIRLRFRLGGTDQARMKAKRRRWEAEPRNHPSDMALIRVPRKEWDAAKALSGPRRSIPHDPRGSIPSDPDQSSNLKTLADAVAAFQEEQHRAVEREERVRSERDAALAELGEHRTRAAVAEAKLEAVEVALARERERADRAEAEARRPFWRRWIG